MATDINIGNQLVYHNYQFPLNSDIINNKFMSILEPGIYQGCDIYLDSSTSTYKIRSGVFSIVSTIVNTATDKKVYVIVDLQDDITITPTSDSFEESI